MILRPVFLNKLLVVALAVVGIATAVPIGVRACPFCNAVKPTLAQSREAATVVVLGEATDAPAGKTAAPQTFRIHTALKGPKRVSGETLRIAADAPVKSGTLALLLGNPAVAPAPSLKDAPAELQWTAIPLDEVAYAYVMQSPDLRQPSVKRLSYFSRFLEHANPQIAEDALAEFAQASFDQTAEVADRLPMADLRKWLGDPAISPARKGFYGLALGLAKNDADRALNRQLLREKITAKDDDFRAGFDGILAGYLLLTGQSGLDLIEARYFANPKAADGDVRHALKAVRFYDQYGHEIRTERITAAVAHLLDRPEFAGEAITDLARWQDGSSLDRIAGLYGNKAYSDPDTRRAIVGYLKTCAKPEAAAALAKLRESDPKGIAAAEEYLSILSGGK